MTKPKGYVYKDRATGKWFARVTVTDANGKRRNIKKTADGGKGAASKLLKMIISDLEDRGAEAVIETDRITFRDLAEK